MKTHLSKIKTPFGNFSIIIDETGIIKTSKDLEIEQTIISPVIDLESPKPITEKINISLHMQDVFLDRRLIKEKTDSCCNVPSFTKWLGIRWIGVPKPKRWFKKESFLGCGCIYRLKMIRTSLVIAIKIIIKGFIK